MSHEVMIESICFKLYVHMCTVNFLSASFDFVVEATRNPWIALLNRFGSAAGRA